MRRFVKHRRARVAFGWLLGLVPQLVSTSAWCATESDPQQSAAVEFDAGVEHFEQGRYEAATQAFLRAHELVSSRDALVNALVSAERASSPPLAAEVATQVLESTVADAPLRTTAQSMLEQALPSVVRLHLSCAPAPCELRLGDREIRTGRHFVNPGTYRLRASSQQTDRHQERDAPFEAGTEYQIAFDLTTSTEETPTPPPASEPSRASPPIESEVFRDEATESLLVGKATISYVAVAATVVLVGATTWSGLDTLHYRRTLQDSASREEVDRVHAKVRRTDFILGASVASALATTAWILWGTDIRTGANPNLDVAFHSGGATLSAKGSF